jgi:rubredoxin/uncharacterized membrane protein
MKKWECTVCGYIHEGDAPPDECPVCGVGPEYFKEVVESEESTVSAPEADNLQEVAKASDEGSDEAPAEPAAEASAAPTQDQKVKKWECTICGYIHEGPEPPDSCPVCGAGPEYFKEIVEKEVKTLTEKVLEPDDGAAQKKGQRSLFRSLVMKLHLHPIAVHTPNGVLPMALVFLVIGVALGFAGFEQAAFYSLVFVLINMPFVIATGYISWQERYNGAKTKLFGVKIGATIVVCATVLAMVVWRLLEPGVAASPGRWTYLLICLISVVAAGLAGHMGGKLVFGARKD